jgi:hypothetical protein
MMERDDEEKGREAGKGGGAELVESSAIGVKGVRERGNWGKRLGKEEREDANAPPLVE